MKKVPQSTLEHHIGVCVTEGLIVLRPPVLVRIFTAYAGILGDGAILDPDLGDACGGSFVMGDPAAVERARRRLGLPEAR